MERTRSFRALWGLSPVLLSLSLLGVGPQWAKEWSADHIPALYNPARCGLYGHAYFAIGAGLSSTSIIVATLMRGEGEVP